MTERTKTRDMIENIGLKPKTPFRRMFYIFFSVLNAFLLIKPETEDSIAHIKKKPTKHFGCGLSVYGIAKCCLL